MPAARNAPAAKSVRRWFRYSLRSLLLLVFAASLGMSSFREMAAGEAAKGGRGRD